MTVYKTNVPSFPPLPYAVVNMTTHQATTKPKDSRPNDSKTNATSLAEIVVVDGFKWTFPLFLIVTFLALFMLTLHEGRFLQNNDEYQPRMKIIVPRAPLPIPEPATTQSPSPQLPCPPRDSNFSVAHLLDNPTDLQILDFIRCYHLWMPRVRLPKARVTTTTAATTVVASVRTRTTPADQNQNSSSECVLMKALQDALGSKDGGLFVEATPGAYRPPLTLFLSRFHGWRGLVLDPCRRRLDRWAFWYPTSWVSDSCLDVDANPAKIPKGWPHCFSLLSFMAIMGETKVDFLNLGYQEHPWSILEPIVDQTRVQLDVISLIHAAQNTTQKASMKASMNAKGFNLLAESSDHFLFQKRTLN